MLYCQHCGTSHDAEANFCPGCGRQLRGKQSNELLMQLQSDTFSTGQPTLLLIFGDGVEATRYNDPIRRDVQRVRYDQIAQVAVRKGWVWAQLIIETRGGGVIKTVGLSPKEAYQAQELIEARM